MQSDKKESYESFGAARLGASRKWRPALAPLSLSLISARRNLNINSMLRLTEEQIEGRMKREYIAVLRRMSPEARLQKAFELTDLGRELFMHGLRRRFPDMSPEQLNEVARVRLAKCHNRIY